MPHAFRNPNLPEGYDATPDGVILSLRRRNHPKTRPLKGCLNPEGYRIVSIRIDGVEKKLYVHHLIAIKFLPPRPSPHHELRHLDGNRDNNAVSNLAWGTHQENVDDRKRAGYRSGFGNRTWKRTALYGVKLAAMILNSTIPANSEIHALASRIVTFNQERRPNLANELQKAEV